MTAENVKRLLGMVPHPREGGWYIRTYESPDMLSPNCFSDARYPGPRRTGTAIYYLLEPDTFSEMHRLQSDEVFHFYAGNSVEMLQLAPGETGKVVRIGPILEEGLRPQVVVPRGVWQGSRLVPGGSWALLGCTVSPGFEFEDYETGDREYLVTHWPQHRGLIEALTHRMGSREHRS
jgi:predicted cupin superfamily sugar epimerase